MQFHHVMQTLTGMRHHGSNCQDAAYAYLSPDLIVLTSCDGCGGGENNDGESQNELAALNTSRAITQSVKEVHHMRSRRSQIWFWDAVQANALRRLQTIMGALHGQPELWMSPAEWKTNVLDSWLCTVVCAYITPELTQIVSIGDGIYAVNGQIRKIDQRDYPSYLAKAVLDNPEFSRFVQHEEVTTAEVETLMIGTDGVTELHTKSNMFYPGTGEPVGPISQLWTRGEFFKDPTELATWLRGINTRRENTGPLAPGQAQVQDGLISDDIGFHVLRK